MISPLMLFSPKACWAFLMQASIVSTSLRQGITTDTSGENASLARIGLVISFNLQPPHTNLPNLPATSILPTAHSLPYVKSIERLSPIETLAQARLPLG